MIDDSALMWKMSGLTPDGTAEPVSGDQFSGAKGDREISVFPGLTGANPAVNTPRPSRGTRIKLRDLLS